MKKPLLFLLFGMILIVIGTLLKINHNELGRYFLIAGHAIEAYILATLVIKSLRK